jgi:EAL domain-containing protein (putative c-di-GMP-specific phosphodiesterase class I)
VETTAHSELLQIQGCQHAQGYAFAKPMPAEDVIEWHRRWRDHAEISPVPRRALTGS